MKYLKVLIWPIMFMVGEFFIQYIFVAYFNNKYYSNTDLYSIINTIEYQNKLNTFINNHTLLIIFITSIIFIPLFYIIFKKYKTNIKLNISIVIKYILLAILISTAYNLYLSIIINYQISRLPIIVQIISSGIIGPIIEELLFRGIIYNKLKEFNSTKKAMIISTIIFSIVHFNIIDIIYTAFIGYILVYIYEKYHTLKYPILFHITANISVILLSLIISYSIILNIILLTICIIILITKYIRTVIKS